MKVIDMQDIYTKRRQIKRELFNKLGWGLPSGLHLSERWVSLNFIRKNNYEVGKLEGFIIIQGRFHNYGQVNINEGKIVKIIISKVGRKKAESFLMEWAERFLGPDTILELQ